MARAAPAKAEPMVRAAPAKAEPMERAAPAMTMAGSVMVLAAGSAAGSAAVASELGRGV
jgi:hypothetical protein